MPKKMSNLQIRIHQLSKSYLKSHEYVIYSGMNQYQPSGHVFWNTHVEPQLCKYKASSIIR